MITDFFLCQKDLGIIKKHSWLKPRKPDADDAPAEHYQGIIFQHNPPLLHYRLSGCFSLSFKTVDRFPVKLIHEICVKNFSNATNGSSDAVLPHFSVIMLPPPESTNQSTLQHYDLMWQWRSSLTIVPPPTHSDVKLWLTAIQNITVTSKWSQITEDTEQNHLQTDVKVSDYGGTLKSSIITHFPQIRKESGKTGFSFSLMWKHCRGSGLQWRWRGPPGNS